MKELIERLKDVVRGLDCLVWTITENEEEKMSTVKQNVEMYEDSIDDLKDIFTQLKTKYGEQEAV